MVEREKRADIELFQSRKMEFEHQNYERGLKKFTPYEEKSASESQTWVNKTYQPGNLPNQFFLPQYDAETGFNLIEHQIKLPINDLNQLLPVLDTLTTLYIGVDGDIAFIRHGVDGLISFLREIQKQTAGEG